MFTKKIHLFAFLVLGFGFINLNLIAQDEAAADDVEEVVVTGTRIQADGFEAVSPVTVVTMEEIDNFGATRIEDVLNTFPQIETSSNNFNPGPDSVSTLDLRGLGSSRTLVLLNGRRLQPGSIYSESPDVGQIPVSLLERVDILTGGASAVYGSDAVAGVVNFITKHADGLSVTMSQAGYRHDNSNSYMAGLQDAKGYPYPTGTSNDGDTSSWEVVVGTDFAGGDGALTLYATKNENDVVYNRDRIYASCGLGTSGTGCLGSANTPVPHFDIYPILKGADGENFTTYEQNFWSILTPDGTIIDDDGTRYNYAAVAQLMNPTERRSFGGLADFKINDTTTFYAEMNYSTFEQRGGIAESGTFGNDEYQILFDNPNLTDAWLSSATAGFVDGANYADGGMTPGEEYCTATGECGEWVGFATYIYKRNVEGGPRQGLVTSDASRVVFGLKGEVGVKDWIYDMSYTHGKTNSVEFWINDFFAPSLVEAIETDAGGYDVFEYQGVTPEQAADMGVVGGMVGTNIAKGLGGYITGSTDFKLPTASNSMSFVVGFESREYTYDRTPDSAYANGTILGFGGAITAISGTIEVDELYTEVNIPVLDNLMADIAFRRSDYNLSGASNTSRFGLTYTVNDTLKFRAGWNEAERAPSVDNYFRPESRSLWTGADLCANSEETGLPTYTQAECANTGMTAAQYGNVTASPASQYYNTIGGNKDLTPEIADTFTAGVVFKLPYGIQASVDYWSIDIEDAIGTIDEETILELCAKQNKYCDLITRSPGGSLWITGGAVDQRLQNLSERAWEGIDISASGSFDLFGGTVDIKTTAANVLDKTTVLVPGNDAGTYDCTGVISNDCYPTPEWRTRTSATYSTGANWSAGLTVRTMSGMDNVYEPDLIAQEAVEDAYNLLDINFRYEINDNLSVRANINNLLDEEPPVVGDVLSGGYGNTVSGFYDTLGMYWNVSVTANY